MMLGDKVQLQNQQQGFITGYGAIRQSSGSQPETVFTVLVDGEKKQVPESELTRI